MQELRGSWRLCPCRSLWDRHWNCPLCWEGTVQPGWGGCGVRAGLGPVPAARAGEAGSQHSQAVTHLTRFVWDSSVAVGCFAVMDNQLGGNSALGRGANK